METVNQAITWIPGGVCAPEGFTAAGMHCGVRPNKTKKDLALIKSSALCDAAAVYTTNKVFGAPILVTREHLKNGKAQAVICNSGIANTCCAGGVEAANRMAAAAAKALGIAENDVIVASTGVIGMPLDPTPIENGLPALAGALSKDGSNDAELAIMTTDTRKKELALETVIGGKTVRIGAIAKGSGMIHPNMATMLSFVTTDAAIGSDMLSCALHDVVDDTYNMVSVDGDSSTNDTLAILANGLAGNAKITEKNADYAAFVSALHAIAYDMARGIAGDGEGATKLLTCHVTGAKTLADARKVAKAVIASSLVKCAMFGADANWGRVLCAAGYSEACFDAEQVDVSFSSQAGTIPVCKASAGVPFSEPLAKTILSEKEVEIAVTLHDGAAEATAFGCDMTYDYVKINGDYRT